MRLPILFLLISLSFNNHAQYSFKEAPLFVRGKIIASIFLQDAYIENLTFGIEKQINKYHSFGIDYIGYREYDDKNTYDSLGNETIIEYRQRTKRKQLLIDYRFYFTNLIFKNNKRLYINLFYKRGKAKMWSENDYIFNENEQIWQNEKTEDLGASIGMHFSNAGKLDNYGIDFNFGVAKRYLTENYESYIDESTSEIILNQKTEKWWLTIRLNLYLNLNTIWQ